MVAQLCLLPAPSTASSPAPFDRLVAETAERAQRQDLERDLAELAKPKLAEWMQERDHRCKPVGFLRIRLADLLILTLRASEGNAAAAVAAMNIYADRLRAMAVRMAKEHRLSPTDADDLLNRGRNAMYDLMGSFEPQRNASYQGYAFPKAEPKRVRQRMMDGVYEFLGLTEHQYRKACEVRGAQEELFKAYGHESTLEELAEALGVKGLETARRYLEYKAIAFDGFGRPCDDAVDADGEEIDEDRGKYGEAEAEDPSAKRLRKGEINFCWRLLEIAKPKMASAIFSKAMLGDLSDDADAVGVGAESDRNRQNVCRGRRLFRAIYRQLDADDPFGALADTLGVARELVAQTYKECVGF